MKLMKICLCLSTLINKSRSVYAPPNKQLELYDPKHNNTCFDFFGNVDSLNEQQASNYFDTPSNYSKPFKITHEDSKLILYVDSATVDYESIDQVINCTSKGKGVNIGKICTIKTADGFTDNYMLKKIDPMIDNKQIINPSLEQNLRFGHQILTRLRIQHDIKTPVTKLLYLNPEQIYYIASKIEEKYTSGAMLKEEAETKFLDLSRTELKELRTKYQSYNNNEIREKYTREQITNKLGGERGIAQLAVIGTLIDDVTGNPGNWGSVEGKFIVIDLDMNMHDKDTIKEIVKQMPFNMAENGVNLSVETLKEMKLIYKDLASVISNDIETGQSKSVSLERINKHELLSLITAYTQAIDNTLKKFDTTYSFNDINISLSEEFDLALSYI